MQPGKDTNEKGHSPGLSSLVPGVVENIIKQVKDRRSLSNMERKTLDEPATKELIQDVFVSSLGEHVNTCTSISEDKIIRQIARHATIHTEPSIEDISIQIAPS